MCKRLNTRSSFSLMEKIQVSRLNLPARKEEWRRDTFEQEACMV